MEKIIDTSKTNTSRRVWSRGDIIAVSGVFVAIVAVFATLLAVPEFRQLIGLDPHMKSSLEKVESLAAGVNISVYQEEFGQPTFINSPKSPTSKMQEKEYIFVNTDFYLDAVTDTNDSVLYFAVTVRNGSFHPVFKGPSPITLGVSKFTVITGEPNFVVACSFEGVKFSYYETHDYGFSGDYQDYGFGVNPTGYVQSGPQMLEDLLGLEQSGYCPGVGPGPGATVPPGAGPPPLSTQQANALKNDIRSNTVINTYAVSTETIKDLNGSFYLGVDYDQIRQLGSQ